MLTDTHLISLFERDEDRILIQALKPCPDGAPGENGQRVLCLTHHCRHIQRSFELRGNEGWY